ncbi:hypothetical protein [Streptomyces sp. NPDC053069]|uniref:hypothetical protein n=1 Tax=Streptomyces sp. NPDC053069 TaxID=3365695 RepID=UPI0037CFD8FB
MSRLPANQFDVIALRILWRMPTERVSEVLGLTPTMVRSSQRNAEPYLKSTPYPPETDEGTTP